MLASKYRLTGVKNFEKVKNEGKLYQYRIFGNSIFERKDKKVSRYAFVVSNKISKQAVQRNRIKRALRESVRQMLNQLKEGYDVVFLAKKALVKMSTDEIMRETKEYLKKSVLYKK